MKKLVLTSVCAFALTSAAFAQGNVGWLTITASAMTGETNTTVSSYLSIGGSAALTGGSAGVTSTGSTYYYELLYNSASTEQAAPNTLAALDNWTDTGLEAQNNTTTAGRLVTINGTAAAQVPWSPGTTDSIIVVGWSANLGSTWAAVSTVLNSPSALSSVVGTAFFGESAVGYITTVSTSTSPGAAVFGTANTAEGTPIDSLLTPLEPISTPEPTTLALGVMGAASLLAFRRKKA